ncbi:hypothetical protein ABIF34_002120 [Bradyrhizobium japonicum]
MPFAESTSSRLAQPRGQNHAAAEHHAAHERTGDAALLRELARLGDVEQTERDKGLRAHQRRGKGQEPDRKARAALAAGELDGGGAQAEAAALGEESKDAADQKAAEP